MRVFTKLWRNEGIWNKMALIWDAKMQSALQPEDGLQTAVRLQTRAPVFYHPPEERRCTKTTKTVARLDGSERPEIHSFFPGVFVSPLQNRLVFFFLYSRQPVGFPAEAASADQRLRINNRTDIHRDGKVSHRGRIYRHLRQNTKVCPLASITAVSTDDQRPRRVFGRGRSFARRQVPQRPTAEQDVSYFIVIVL